MRTIAARVALLTVLVAAAAVVGGAARAGFIPSWGYLSAPLRTRLAAQSGGSLFLPARAPLFYRYRSGATVANGVLTVPFTNRVRIRQGLWRWTKNTFVWRVQPHATSVDCMDWKARDKTLQVDGNKVFWSAGSDGGTAWRCVNDRRGRPLVLSASAGGRIGDVGLAIVVASGLDVSRRTSIFNVSLAVIPSSVRGGGSVLVRGVAGRCTAGDTVTLLSRAFPATHSFAGVPAVLAQVGAAGRFSAITRIPTTRPSGTYLVTARCGGGNLGVSAHLTVRR